MTKLAHYTIRKLMAKAGANKVSKRAVELMARIAEDYIQELTGKALLIMQKEDPKRKTLMDRDVELIMAR